MVAINIYNITRSNRGTGDPLHFLSQANSINQPSLGLDWLLLKPPDGARIERCLHDTVNSKPLLSVEQHSPEPLVVVIPPVPKPVSTRAYSCCIQNATVAAKRCIVDVVSTNVDVGATKHLLLTKAAFALPNPSSARLLRMVDLHNSSLELVMQTLKPPNRVAYNQLLHEAVNTLNKWTYSVTYLGWNATTPRRSLCSSPLRPLLRIAGRGRRMLRCPRLLVAVFGQHN